MTAWLPTPPAADWTERDAPRRLLEHLLAEQQELTAIEEFSRAHDAGALPGPLYQELLPATAPRPGQQYAFEVDLDKCFGCKACVGACHSLNGLEDNETWRGVGLLVGDPAEDVRARRGAMAFQQHITTACHHCVDPACLTGCPVLAYDKDPRTGIVRHLDDQCIGCQYCVMMCPYEVPQYSKARGIVRKCDLCHGRLTAGEAPACAQACPGGAIHITLVEVDKVRGKYRGLPGSGLRSPGSAWGTNGFLAASPNPALTLPTTRFVTQRVLPERLFAGDDASVRRADPHWPLVWLLVLSQLAAGASAAAVWLQPALPLALTALMGSVGALAAGTLHLGRPLKAWRAFLGWRTSWFSREVMLLAAFVLLAALTAACLAVPVLARFGRLLAPLAALAGLVTVGCSAMIYVDTRREFWNAPRTFARFVGSTLLLGAAAALASLALGGSPADAFNAVTVVLLLTTLAKLGCEHRIFAHLVDEETPAQTPLNKTARLLTGELGGFVRARLTCGVLGGVVLPLFALMQGEANPAAVVALALASLGLCAAGEVLERFLFFSAVAASRMPGAIPV